MTDLSYHFQWMVNEMFFETKCTQQAKVQAKYSCGPFFRVISTLIFLFLTFSGVIVCIWYKLEATNVSETFVSLTKMKSWCRKKFFKNIFMYPTFWRKLVQIVWAMIIPNFFEAWCSCPVGFSSRWVKMPHNRHL